MEPQPATTGLAGATPRVEPIPQGEGVIPVRPAIPPEGKKSIPIPPSPVAPKIEPQPITEPVKPPVIEAEALTEAEIGRLLGTKRALEKELGAKVRAEATRLTEEIFGGEETGDIFSKIKNVTSQIELNDFLLARLQKDELARLKGIAMGKRVPLVTGGKGISIDKIAQGLKMDTEDLLEQMLLAEKKRRVPAEVQRMAEENVRGTITGASLYKKLTEVERKLSGEEPPTSPPSTTADVGGYTSYYEFESRVRNILLERAKGVDVSRKSEALYYMYPSDIPHPISQSKTVQLRLASHDELRPGVVTLVIGIPGRRIISSAASFGIPEEATDAEIRAIKADALAVADELKVGMYKDGFDLRIEGNIRIGLNAMDKVITEQADVMNAMFRPDLGNVTFYWGNPGNPNKGFAGGAGIAHIIAKRGTEVARKMVEVIAKGDIVKKYGPKDGERVNISYDNSTAVLSLYKYGNKETWLLTGWKNRTSDVPSEVSGPSESTHTEPMHTRPDMGAEGSKQTIPLSPESVNRPRLPPSATADVGGYAKTPLKGMELPEIVELAKEINEGKYPQVKERLRAFRGQALGQFSPTGIKLRADIFKDPPRAHLRQDAPPL